MNTKKKTAAEKQWKLLTKRIDRADAAARAARAARLAFVAKHFQKRPLSAKTTAALTARVRASVALCCTEGREYPDKVVDPIWAEALNVWAYQALSCKGMRPTDIPEYCSKVEAIVTDPKALASYGE